MDRLARTIEILDDLIAFPTVSADSNLEMIVYLASLLSDAGAHVDLFHDESGLKANLLATLGPDTPGGLLLSGHTDVVAAEPSDWTSDPFSMRRDGTRLFGRGACDMKGFIAAVMASLPAFAQVQLSQPIRFAFTYDEEVGCLGARDLVGELRRRAIKPDIAIIGEPTEMRIIEGHKGCNEYTTRFKGLEGHGSTPGAGVNAVEYAVRYSMRLLELSEALKSRASRGCPFDPPFGTINIGQIRGGSARNVIAGAAEVQWELRTVCSEDADFVKCEMRNFEADVLLPQMQRIAPHASIETLVIGEVDGLQPSEWNPARTMVAELTGQETYDLVAFSTEAGLFQSLGTSAVVCGPGSIAQAHGPDEYIEISQLTRCLALLEGVGHGVSRTNTLP